MAILLKNIYGQKSGPFKKLLPAVAKKSLPHALLFAGPSGVGKAKTAWAIAQALLCEQKELACGSCPSCKKVEDQSHSSILYIQPEGLYIKSVAVKTISRFLSLQSFALAKVVIIDSAHQMNAQTANGILKILEEPPDNVYFILISSHISALPATVRSRTQKIVFSLLSIEDMKNILSFKEGKPSVPATKDFWILKASRGRMDNLENWQNYKEQRKSAFDLFQKCVLEKQLCDFGDLADQVKQREKALFVCLCWQQILRDACLQNVAKHRVIHQDQEHLLQILSQKPFNVLNAWFQKIAQLEQDLKHFVSAPLAFDHFFLFAREF